MKLLGATIRNLRAIYNFRGGTDLRMCVERCRSWSCSVREARIDGSNTPTTGVGTQLALTACRSRRSKGRELNLFIVAFSRAFSPIDEAGNQGLGIRFEFGFAGVKTGFGGCQSFGCNVILVQGTLICKITLLFVI